MGIAKTSIIDRIQNTKYQNSAHWEFRIAGAPDYMQWRVKSADVPYTTLETKTANTGNKYITGYTPEGDFSISFYEDVEMSVHNYLLNWRTSLFSNRARVFHSSNLKTMYLTLYHYDDAGIKQEVLEYVFGKVIIKGVTPYSFTYEGGDVLVTAATFTPSTGIGINYRGQSVGSSEARDHVKSQVDAWYK